MGMKYEAGLTGRIAYGNMAEWLRRLFRNQLEAIPREFESLCCRVFFFFSLWVWCRQKYILLSAYHLLIGPRGATDSVSDLESGDWGSNYRRACSWVFPLLWAVGLVVWFSLWVREVAGSIPTRPLFKPPDIQSYAHNRVALQRKAIF